MLFNISSNIPNFDSNSNDMESIQYTGTNYPEVKAFAKDKILAPYFCMGFSMLSLMTNEGFVTVNEGDYIVKDSDGNFSVKH